MSGTNDPNAAAQPATEGAQAPAGAGAHPADSYGEADSGERDAAAHTQNAPVQDMHSAGDEDKIAGIVAQTRQDVGDKDQARIADVLRQRLTESGVSVADDRVAALAAEVSRG